MPIINQIVKGGGGSAPAHYIEKTVDANGKLVNSSNLINLNNVTDVGKYVCYGQYVDVTFPLNTQVDLSGLTSISGDSAFGYCFQNSTNIVSVDISSLSTITAGSTFVRAFEGCSTLTSADLSSLTTITGWYCLDHTFYNCSALTSVNLSSLQKINANVCSSMCQYCIALTSVDLGALEVVNGNNCFYNAFNGCTSLTNVNLSKLTVSWGGGSFWYMFYGCTSLPSITLYSLKTLATNTCNNMFTNCTSLASLSFPALNSSSFNGVITQFVNMLTNVTGCTVHFPKNLDPQGGSTVISSLTGYPDFSGTNTVLVFDLPSTFILTGANTTEYERSPKDDTATALAWRVKDTGTAPNLTIDWTPYYTSGTTDPQVGDTIYSDSACTTAVTTIDSIA